MPTKVNKKDIRRWIDLLRSDKFQQDWFLTDGDVGRCAIGAGISLYPDLEVEMQTSFDQHWKWQEGYPEILEDPAWNPMDYETEFCRRMFDGYIPYLQIKGERRDLIEANKVASYTEIADALEQQFL